MCLPNPCYFKNKSEKNLKKVFFLVFFHFFYPKVTVRPGWAPEGTTSSDPLSCRPPLPDPSMIMIGTASPCCHVIPPARG